MFNYETISMNTTTRNKNQCVTENG